MSGFTAADVPSQEGKCFIVTGANAGIGFEAAKVLAASSSSSLVPVLPMCGYVSVTIWAQ